MLVHTHVYVFGRKLIKQRILMSCFKYLSAIYPAPTVLPPAPQLRSPISPRFLLSTYLLPIGVLECLIAVFQVSRGSVVGVHQRRLLELGFN